MRLIHDDAVFKDAERHALPDVLTVVLTRFNMKVAGFRRDGLEDEQSFQRYVRTRIPVFNAICAPSLMGQKTRPDAWLLGMDSERRDETAPLLQSFAAEPWIVPAWQETKASGYENHVQTFSRAILGLLKPHHRHVITIRVDNDDALSRSFVHAAHLYASAAIAKRPEQDDFWITFPVGAQLAKGRCFLYTRGNNAFLSRCVSVERFLKKPQSTALERNHTLVFDAGVVYSAVTVHPMWLQSVNAGNLLNRHEKSFLAFRSRDRIFKQFSLDRDAALKALSETKPAG